MRMQRGFTIFIKAEAQPIRQMIIFIDKLNRLLFIFIMERKDRNSINRQLRQKLLRDFQSHQ